MHAPQETVWEMREPTPAKHRILRSYLGCWLPTILPQHERVRIFDCFAGPGEYTGGAKGSPLIAMDVLYRCASSAEQRNKVSFVFIDNHERRYYHLKDLVEKMQGQMEIDGLRTPRIEWGPFVRKMKTRLNKIEKQQEVACPTFAFIDPFGLKDIPMSIIAYMIRVMGCDVLITLMYEELNRFLSHRNILIQRRFTELFATEQWRDINLNGDRRQQICHLYRTQLQNVGGVRYVTMFRLQNQKNAIDYLLVFGTNSRVNLEMMKDAFWEVDPTYGCSYSAHEQAKNIYRPPLLAPEPNYAPLRRQLQDCFSGRTVSIDDLDTHVLTETSYRIKEYKAHVLADLERASRIAVISPNPHRKAGEYVRADLIRFQ